MFSIGKKIFGGNDDNAEGAGVDLSNPFAMLFQLDADGDGKITEKGTYKLQKKL